MSKHELYFVGRYPLDRLLLRGVAASLWRRSSLEPKAQIFCLHAQPQLAIEYSLDLQFVIYVCIAGYMHEVIAIEPPMEATSCREIRNGMQ